MYQKPVKNPGIIIKLILTKNINNKQKDDVSECDFFKKIALNLKTKFKLLKQNWKWNKRTKILYELFMWNLFLWKNI